MFHNKLPLIPKSFKPFLKQASETMISSFQLLTFLENITSLCIYFLNPLQHHSTLPTNHRVPILLLRRFSRIFPPFPLGWGRRQGNWNAWERPRCVRNPQKRTVITVSPWRLRRVLPCGLSFPTCRPGHA